jgi:hypothetical protein
MTKKSLLATSVIISVFLSVSTGIVSATYGVQTKTSNCTNNQILPDFACSPGALQCMWWNELQDSF